LNFEFYCAYKLDDFALTCFFTQILSEMSPSRRSSLIDISDGEDDTFERVFKVNAHQEALLAYYYLNHSGKMEFDRPCEVYSVNETQSSIPTSPTSTLAPSRVYEVGM